MKKGVSEHKIKGESLGASGFTLAVLSVISLGIIGMIFSAVGFIFCLIQQKNKPTKLGKAGTIISIIGFILSLFWVVYLGPLVNGWLV